MRTRTTTPWTRRALMALPVAALMACGRNASSAADDALKSDLALAAQTTAASSTISPTESGLAPQLGTQLAPSAPQASARQHTYTAPARRTTVHHASSGAARSSSGGGYYPAPAPAPPPVTVKHTQRDAAIGAATGAVLGASTSRNKIRGGLIGAALGGVLGGMIGNNVDIQKKP